MILVYAVDKSEPAQSIIECIAYKLHLQETRKPRSWYQQAQRLVWACSTFIDGTFSLNVHREGEVGKEAPLLSVPTMGLSSEVTNPIHEISFPPKSPPPNIITLGLNSSIRFQHINIDSDYSSEPGTLSAADTLTDSPWFRRSSELSGTLMNVCFLVSSSPALKISCLLCLYQPHNVWQIQLMMFMIEPAWMEKKGVWSQLGNVT